MPHRFYKFIEDLAHENEKKTSTEIGDDFRHPAIFVEFAFCFHPRWGFSPIWFSRILRFYFFELVHQHRGCLLHPKKIL